MPRTTCASAPRTWPSDQALAATLESDHDNLRAALRFSLDAGDAATALQLCAALWRFWFERGYLSEGRLWLDESLAASSEASPARARALSGNGVLARYQGDYDRAEELCREALELFRSLDDFKGVAEASTGLALVRSARGDYLEAETLYREALSIYERLGEEAGIARTLDRFALNFVVTGEFDRARPLFERSLALFRRLGDSHGVALGLYGLSVTRLPGADAAALAQADESLDILRAVGDRRTFAKVLWNLADINAELGDAETAAAQFAESLTLFIEFGDRWFCGIVLESAAFLAGATATPSVRSACSARPTRSGRRSKSRFRRCFASVTITCSPRRAAVWERRAARLPGTRAARFPLARRSTLSRCARERRRRFRGRSDRPRDRGARDGRHGPHGRGGRGAARREHPHRPRAPALDLPQARRAHAKRRDTIRARARTSSGNRCLSGAPRRS